MMEVSPEMQQRILSTRGELQAVKARIAAAEHSKRMLQLTQRQIANEETGGHVWQSVGRTFVKVSTNDYSENVEEQQKELDQQISSLQKKENYYATTLEKMILAFKEQ